MATQGTTYPFFIIEKKNEVQATILIRLLYMDQRSKSEEAYLSDQFFKDKNMTVTYQIFHQ